MFGRNVLVLYFMPTLYLCFVLYTKLIEGKNLTHYNPISNFGY